MTPGQALVEMAQNFLRHETQIAELARQQHETAAQVMALVKGEDYITVVGWANVNKLRLDAKTTQKIGKAATLICQQRGFTVGKATHPLFGEVNTYPREVLDGLANNSLH